MYGSLRDGLLTVHQVWTTTQVFVIPIMLEKSHLHCTLCFALLGKRIWPCFYGSMKVLFGFPSKPYILLQISSRISWITPDTILSSKYLVTVTIVPFLLNDNEISAAMILSQTSRDSPRLTVLSFPFKSLFYFASQFAFVFCF